MNCAELEERLDELVEDRLDPETRRVAEEHLRRCPACRSEVEGLRRLLAEARTLPAAVEPRADLWPRIERRLATRGAVRSVRLDWRVLAAAAVVTVAFITAAVLLRPGLAPAVPPATGSTAPAGAPALAVETGSPARFRAAEEALLETKRQLRQALDERRPEMSPQTAAAVDRNLALIEKAIDEIRVALERDPASPQLNRMLLAAHQQELALLQRVTQRGRPL